MRKIYTLILTCMAFLLCSNMQAQEGKIFQDDFFKYKVIDAENMYVALQGYDNWYEGGIPEMAVVPATATDPDDSKVYTVTEVAANAFYWTNLNGITFQGPLKKVGNEAFASSGLQKLVFEQPVDTIGYRAFYYNRGLKEVEFKKTVKALCNEAFYYSVVEHLTYPAGLDSVGEYVFAYNNISEITFPKEPTKFGRYMFSWNSALESVTIPANIKVVAPYSFYGNPNLSVYLEEGVEEIGVEAFHGQGTAVLTLPSTITKLGNRCFASGGNHKRIIAKMQTPPQCDGFDYDYYQNVICDVPDGRLQAYIDKGWDNFKYLKEISQPDPVFFVADGIRYHALDATTCEVSKSESGWYDFEAQPLTIPANVTDSETGKSYKVVALGEGCFDGAGMTSLTLPEGIERIEWEALENCYQMTEVNFPSTLKYIGAYAFAFTGIEKAHLNDGIETVESAAFVRCMHLKSAVLPASLVDVYEMDVDGEGNPVQNKVKGLLWGAFAMNDSLKAVTSYITDPHDDYIFRELPDSAVLTVPTGLLEKYCAVASEISWGAFDIIQDMSGRKACRISIDGGWMGAFTINGGEKLDRYAGFLPEGTKLTITIYPSEERYIVDKVYLGEEDITSQLDGNTIVITTDGGIQKIYITYAEQVVLKQPMQPSGSGYYVDLTGNEDVAAWVATEFDETSVYLERVYKVYPGMGVILTGPVGSVIPTISEADWGEFAGVNMLASCYSWSWYVNPSSWTTEGTTKNYVLTKDPEQSYAYYFIEVTEAVSLDERSAFLAILKSKFSGEAPAGFEIKFKGVETGLENIVSETQEKAIYDLQGRRVQQAKSGLYIINGKKVLVK